MVAERVFEFALPIAIVIILRRIQERRTGVQRLVHNRIDIVNKKPDKGRYPFDLCRFIMSAVGLFLMHMK